MTAVASRGRRSGVRSRSRGGTATQPPSSAAGFGVSYFEALLGVGALHSRINLPLKWFLGTYPVFVDLVHEAMLEDVPERPRYIVTVRKAGSGSSASRAA